MGPIVLLTGVLVLLYAVAAIFAGGSVASASRGVSHSRTYAVVTAVIAVALIVTGLVMMLR